MDENGCRPSGLRAPSKMSAKVSATVHSSQPNARLQESTESQNNARAQSTVAGGTKRNLSAQSTTYPDAKRKPVGTGMEFQGKPSGVPTAGKSLRGTSIKDLNRVQNAGNQNTANRRLPNPKSTFGSVTAPGTQQTRAHTRAQSAAARPVRPATSIGTRETREGSNGIVPQQQHSAEFAPQPGNQDTKALKKHKSTQELSSSNPTLPRQREASWVNKFGKMTLKNEKQERQREAQANSSLQIPPSSLPICKSPRRGGGNCKLPVPKHTSNNSNTEAQRNQVVVVMPHTPSEKDRLLANLTASIRAFSKTPARYAYSSSPTKAPFLTRCSNVTTFIVNDIDEVVHRMDGELKAVRQFMESTERNSATTRDELEVAKKRVIALEEERNELRSERTRLKDELDDAGRLSRGLQYDMEELKKQFERQMSNLQDDQKRDADQLNEQFKRELEKNEKLQLEFEARCGAEAEARLESLSQDNKDLRSSLEKQKRDHEHEIRLLNETLERRNAELHKLEHDLRTSSNERLELQVHVEGNLETIERLRKRAQDAEERLSKDQGHLGGQISLLSSTLDLKSERIQTLEENAKKLQADCELEIENIKSAAEQQIADETAVLRNRLVKEEERRHKLFEQVQELKGNIRVMCRIKPPTRPETDALIPFQPQWNEIDEEKIDGLTIPTSREDPTEPGRMLAGKPRDFSFERVFDAECTNRDVFDEISQLVQSVMDGKKVCIFCYGQTGSGKTYTMSKRQGDGDDGVIPRTQGMIFSEVERLRTLGWEYTVEGSYLEVYQDKLYDLLASRHSKPEALSVDSVGDELRIKGHSFTLLTEARDLEAMIATADANRHVAATAKNDRSSRSHSILVLKIRGVKKGANGEVLKTRKGTLNLIDLAGSEKPDKTGNQQVYREGVEINSSLSYLRTVLSGLGQGKTEGVDFRSYTLTQLLRPSLGKGCRTLMFVMVSPLKENENETIRSLEFARDAQKVKMGGNGGKSSKK